MIIKNIQKIRSGEDYTEYSYVDVNGEEHEVEITGFAQVIIDTLGKALYKESFLKKPLICGHFDERPAMSRYNHGDICSDCGTKEALHGDFLRDMI